MGSAILFVCPIDGISSCAKRLGDQARRHSNPNFSVNSIVAVNPQFDAVDEVRLQEADLYFYGRVLGFIPAYEIDPVATESESDH